MNLPLTGSLSPLGSVRHAAAAYPLDGVADVRGAYSLRRLRTAYTGPLVRLRRSTDNVESDFGYDSNGKLDTAAITTWLGAATGYAAVWYDQSGGGWNLTQTVAANQPTYDNSGAFPALVTELNPVGMVSELDILRPFAITMTTITTAGVATPRHIQSRDVNAVFAHNRLDGNPAFVGAAISAYNTFGTVTATLSVAGGVSSYHVEGVDRTATATVNNDWRRLALASSGTNTENGQCKQVEIVVIGAARSAAVESEQASAY